MSYARLRIDLSALAANYRLFKSKSANEVGAVVKANGYGLGAVKVVECLVAKGCESFFVATLDEAFQIKPLVTGAVYVFEPPRDALGLRKVAEVGCVPVINTEEQLEIALNHPNVPVAIHIDTGMERLGIPYQKADPNHLGIPNATLLMTHLACADEPNNSFNRVQVDRFQVIAKELSHIPTSIGNSAATLTGEPFQGDVARPGIGLYGANPFMNLENPLKIVARCEAQVLDIRNVPRGASVGYRGSFVAKRSMRVAVVGMGYADGIPHVLSNVGHLAFGERQLPIVGRISMDLTQIDATECNELKVGDWVEFFGDTIDVDDVAKVARSFGYEFLTGIGPRVERVYV